MVNFYIENSYKGILHKSVIIAYITTVLILILIIFKLLSSGWLSLLSPAKFFEMNVCI